MIFFHEAGLVLLLYAGLTFFHLGAIVRGAERSRRLSKLAICPLLLLVYLLSLRGWATPIAPSYWLLAALFFSFWGDAALLGEERKWTALGMLAFLLAQFSYLGYIVGEFGPLVAARPERLPASSVLVFVAVLYLAVGLVLVARLRKKAARLLPLVALYGLALSAMSYGFLLLAYCEPNLGRWLAFGGSLSFLLSDALLSDQLFIKASMRRQRALMGFYCLAQACIVLGCVLSEWLRMPFN